MNDKPGMRLAAVMSTTFWRYEDLIVSSVGLAALAVLARLRL
jgi:hypothetical protein